MIQGLEMEAGEGQAFKPGNNLGGGIKQEALAPRGSLQLGCSPESLGSLGNASTQGTP